MGVRVDDEHRAQAAGARQIACAALPVRSQLRPRAFLDVQFERGGNPCVHEKSLAIVAERCLQKVPWIGVASDAGVHVGGPALVVHHDPGVVVRPPQQCRHAETRVDHLLVHFRPEGAVGHCRAGALALTLLLRAALVPLVAIERSTGGAHGLQRGATAVLALRSVVGHLEEICDKI